MSTPSAAEFAGEWVGETMGCDMPAHVWELRAHSDDCLSVLTRWEDKTEGDSFNAHLHPETGLFELGEGAPLIRLDAQHFVIPGWDTNNTRGDFGPAYDVVFSRPGIAELSARRLWERWRKDPGSLISACGPR